MLTLTERAAEAVRDIVASEPDLPAGAGLRLVAQAHGDHVHLGMELVEGPEPTDQVIDHAGALVFVEQGLVEDLANVTMDASEEDGEYTFDLDGWEEPH